jgi:hypothetical protein
MPLIVRHHTSWAAPAPLWPEARMAANPTARGAAIGRPAILRFASDEFMDELAAILERDPSQLAYLRAIPETWRNPAPRVDPPAPLGGLNRRLRHERAALPVPAAPAGSAAIERARLTTLVPERPCKLYHPAHQRFYLVAACLVCDTPGLPDHVLDTGERAAFVVRRLRPKAGVTGAPDPIGWAAGWDEYAFVPQGREHAWKLAKSTDPSEGEERLPLFPMAYIAEDGRRRRLLAGLLPVARRDAYMAAPVNVQPGEANLVALDPRLAFLRNDFTQPYLASKEILDNIERVVQMTPRVGDPPKDEEKDSMRQGAKDQVQVASWYALLDFSIYLRDYLPRVRHAIGAPFPPEMPTNLPLPEPGQEAAENALLAQLRAVGVGAIKLDAALSLIESWRAKLENTTQAYTNTDSSNPPDPNTWPMTALPFPLTDAGLASLFSNTTGGATALEALIKAALPTAIPLRTAEPPPAAGAPPRAGDPAYFIARCIHEKPGCGPMHPPTLSAPSLAFEPASFFDPDAPARPIRIALPIDSTPGGLRKYTKSVALMLSDQLACQKKNLGGITFGDLVLSVLPWPFHQDLPVGSDNCRKGLTADIGLICSLSIPIITICALFLLIIIVSLLDMIFHWAPFFILCFPLPNFKGKK